jgi:hypothetical protein
MCRFRADRSRGAAVFLVFGLTFGGCGARTPPLSLADDARTFVRLAVALGERDPDSLDFYSGPFDLVADVRASPPPFAEIKRQAAAVSDRVSNRTHANAAEARRGQLLLQNIAALRARVDLLTGTRLPYDQESQLFFGIAPAPLDQRRLEDIRSQVAALVGGSGRLVDRYAAFAERFTIPPPRLEAVMTAALDECRRRTAAHITLPKGERVTLEIVNNKPWSAYSRYLGAWRSVVQVNADFRFSVDQALQVACHEGYPGHHTRNVLIESRRAAGDREPEHWVQLTFSRGSLVSEAAAMAAADVALPAAERVGVERDRLFALAGLRADDVARHVEVERLVGELQIVQAEVARRYLDGELEFVRAATVLEEQALVPHAEAAIKYVNEYRSYATTYTVGRAAFAARLAACAGADQRETARWRCFEAEMVKPEL